jgi:hypothetical protein
LEYNFDWNLEKERLNIKKHGINFRKASTIFHDPCQLSIYDEEHSDYEDRWITIGIDGVGVLRVVIHTFEQIDEFNCNIRIISARKATNKEIREYQNKNL